MRSRHFPTALGAALTLLLGCGGESDTGIQGPASVDTVIVTAPTTEIRVDQTVQLTATAQDEDGNVLEGKSFEWTSGIGTVATVSQTGIVTGHVKGQSEIRATTEGVSGSLIITVQVALPPQ